MAQLPKDSEDRSYQTCSFTITPLQIITKEKGDASSGKKSKENTVLIKLGSATEKRQHINEPMQFTFAISYSKALRKYYPIKGMIKIYDKNQNGTEMILGVGGFSTDQILNQGLTSAQVTKQIGPVKLKLSIKAEKQYKGNIKEQFKQRTQINDPGCLNKEGQNRESREEAVRNKISLTSVNSLRVSQDPDQNETFSPINKFRSSERMIGSKQQSKNIQLKFAQSEIVSNQDIRSMIQLNQSQYSRDIIKKQMQAIGQQLISQRRINQILEQSLKNAKLKIKFLKDERKQQAQFLIQMEKLQQEKIKLMQQIHEKDAQIRALKRVVNQKKNSLASQQNIQKRLNMQRETIIKLEEKVNSLYKQIDQAQENNAYLRQKQSNSQSIIFSKDNTIEHLGKLISNQNKEIQQSKKQIKYFNKTVSNLQLTNEQFKQEISELSQTVEKYKSKYGDLGNLKNKALEQQIKQCIRWIDSQGRDSQFNEAQQTMQSDLNHSESFSSVIRSLEIQSLPLPEISDIRSQLVKILERVDSLLSRS